jgi:HK97 gp10 family phage protein
MKVGAKIDQAQLKQLVGKMEELKKYSTQGLSDEIGAIAMNAARRAKRVAPASAGPTLKRQIGSQAMGMNAVVYAKTHYAPYVEFGTGMFVDLSETQALGIPDSYAWQFKGKKDGYMHPQPFFFNSIRYELKAGLDRIEKRLKDITK